MHDCESYDTIADIAQIFEAIIPPNSLYSAHVLPSDRTIRARARARKEDLSLGEKMELDDQKNLSSSIMSSREARNYVASEE